MQKCDVTTFRFLTSLYFFKQFLLQKEITTPTEFRICPFIVINCAKVSRRRWLPMRTSNRFLLLLFFSLFFFLLFFSKAYALSSQEIHIKRGSMCPFLYYRKKNIERVVLFFHFGCLYIQCNLLDLYR